MKRQTCQPHNIKKKDLKLHLQNNLANNDTEDLVIFLASKVYTVNIRDPDQFLCSTEFDAKEPETYARAMQGPNTVQQAKAMEEELDHLHKNETWTLVPKNNIKLSHCLLRSKWFYKLKRDVNKNIAWFKVRWVIKRYFQQYGVDFNQIFATVVKPMAFCVLFTIAAFYDLDIDQIDIKTAFLYGLIN